MSVRPGVARLSLAIMLAGLVIVMPSKALGVAAADSVSIDCPVSTPDDAAVAGSDTFVAGQVQGAGSMNVLACRLGAGGAAAWKRTLLEHLAPESVHVAAGSTGLYLAFTVTDSIGWTHAVIQRLGLDGSLQQRVETASGGHDVLGDIAVGPDGRVYVTGYTKGDLLSAPPANAYAKAFVRSFDANLNTSWTRQFQGTSISDNLVPEASSAAGTGLAVNATGVYLVGWVDGTLPGGPSVRSGRDGYVRRYSTTGTVMWTRQFDGHYGYADPPPEAPTDLTDLVLSPQGVYVVGGASWLGGGFERLYDGNGSVVWTTMIGSSASPGQVIADRGGTVLVGVANLGIDASDDTTFFTHLGADGSIGATLEFWLGSWSGGGGMVAVGDGEFVRAASIVTAPPVWNPPPDLTVLPVGAFLYRFDLVPPSVAAPVVKPVSHGSVGTTLPVSVSWTASDAGSGIAGTEVQVSRDGGAWGSFTLALSSTRSLVTSARVGGKVRFRARATDGAENTSAWSYSPTITITAVQETAAAVVESSSWRRVAEGGALGGYVDATSTYGASAKYRFTGRAIAWIGAIAPTRGNARVYVDGRLVATVSCYSATWLSHRVVYAWSGTYATHTLEIRNLATSGRPRLDLDAFIVLK